jgi:hypothetical protein
MREEGYRALQIRKSTTFAALESTAVRLSISDSAIFHSLRSEHRLIKRSRI